MWKFSNETGKRNSQANETDVDSNVDVIPSQHDWLRFLNFPVNSWIRNLMNPMLNQTTLNRPQEDVVVWFKHEMEWNKVQSAVDSEKFFIQDF